MLSAFARDTKAATVISWCSLPPEDLILAKQNELYNWLKSHSGAGPRPIFDKNELAVIKATINGALERKKWYTNWTENKHKIPSLKNIEKDGDELTLDETKFIEMFRTLYSESKDFREALLIQSIGVAVKRLGYGQGRGPLPGDQNSEAYTRFCSAMACQSPALYAYWREHFALGSAPSHNTVKVRWRLAFIVR